jgi:hypothetical protein
MTDNEYLEMISGQIPVEVDAEGHTVKEIPFGSIPSQANDKLTSAFDAIFGPDEVDSFDASCNTCKHFQRKSMTPEEKKQRNTFGMPGHCAKKDIPLVGWQRGQFCAYENAECYENRRMGMTYQQACKPRGEDIG